MQPTDPQCEQLDPLMEPAPDCEQARQNAMPEWGPQEAIAVLTRLEGAMTAAKEQVALLPRVRAGEKRRLQAAVGAVQKSFNQLADSCPQYGAARAHQAGISAVALSSERPLVSPLEGAVSCSGTRARRLPATPSSKHRELPPTPPSATLQTPESRATHPAARLSVSDLDAASSQGDVAHTSRGQKEQQVEEPAQVEERGVEEQRARSSWAAGVQSRIQDKREAAEATASPGPRAAERRSQHHRQPEEQEVPWCSEISVSVEGAPAPTQTQHQLLNDASSAEREQPSQSAHLQQQSGGASSSSLHGNSMDASPAALQPWSSGASNGKEGVLLGQQGMPSRPSGRRPLTAAETLLEMQLTLGAPTDFGVAEGGRVEQAVGTAVISTSEQPDSPQGVVKDAQPWVDTSSETMQNALKELGADTVGHPTSQEHHTAPEAITPSSDTAEQLAGQHLRPEQPQPQPLGASSAPPGVSVTSSKCIGAGGTPVRTTQDELRGEKQQSSPSIEDLQRLLAEKDSLIDALKLKCQDSGLGDRLTSESETATNRVATNHVPPTPGEQHLIAPAEPNAEAIQRPLSGWSEHEEAKAASAGWFVPSDPTSSDISPVSPVSTVRRPPLIKANKAIHDHLRDDRPRQRAAHNSLPKEGSIAEQMSSALSSLEQQISSLETGCHVGDEIKLESIIKHFSPSHSPLSDSAYRRYESPSLSPHSEFESTSSRVHKVLVDAGLGSELASMVVDRAVSPHDNSSQMERSARDTIRHTRELRAKLMAGVLASASDISPPSSQGSPPEKRHVLDTDMAIGSGMDAAKRAAARAAATIASNSERVSALKGMVSQVSQESLFDEIDTNKDGVVDRTEFTVARAASTLRNNSERMAALNSIGSGSSAMSNDPKQLALQAIKRASLITSAASTPPPTGGSSLNQMDSHRVSTTIGTEFSAAHRAVSPTSALHNDATAAVSLLALREGQLADAREHGLPRALVDEAMQQVREAQEAAERSVARLEKLRGIP